MIQNTTIKKGKYCPKNIIYKICKCAKCSPIMNESTNSKGLPKDYDYSNRNLKFSKSVNAVNASNRLKGIQIFNKRY